MKNVIALIGLTVLLPGCASDPPGATVQFRGQTCVTPCALTVPRGGKPEMVDFSMDGREPYYGEVARAYPEEVPRTESGASKAVIGVAAMLDAIVFPIGILNEMSGLYYDWPKELNASLPEKGKGSALMRTIR
jgi:hypothetical protein